MKPMTGQIALITGATAGIGRACALALAGLGMRVIAAGRRADRLAELRQELAAASGRGPAESACETLVLDVRDRAAVLRELPALRDRGWGEIEVLVNNAGLAAGFAPLHQGDFDHWDRMLDTNVKGLLNVTRVVAPWMVERGRGHIVNIGSVAGRTVYPMGNAYCASKHAVRALNQGMRMDLLGTGIRVTSVDPGLVETEFSLVRFEGDAERARKPYEGMTPLTPEDVADAVVWAATRPPHVNVEEILLMPTDQASAIHVHRRHEA